jgi:hypothetical protein
MDDNFVTSDEAFGIDSRSMGSNLDTRLGHPLVAVPKTENKAFAVLGEWDGNSASDSWHGGLGRWNL